MRHRVLGALGGLGIATAGVVMGSMNAGWIGEEPDANAVFPLLGAGVLLVFVAWVLSGWIGTLWRSAIAGPPAAVLLAAASILFVANPVLDFAIFGSLAFAAGLVLHAIAVWVRRLLDPLDRVIATLAAVASLTWNTETTSAFLLVAVGALLAALTLRLPAGKS